VSDRARRVDVEGCNNFRDLGGYPTQGGHRLRWRRLFRADALHHVTSRGVATLTEEIGLGAILDLRSSGELGADGRGPLGGVSITFHHLPLFDGEVSEGDRAEAASLTLADRYVMMATFAAEPIARVLRTLAETDAPAVFHCAAGKDRTGVISAVLLGLLGVPDELIVADYAESRESLDAIVARLRESEGYREMFERLPPDTLHAEPETMRAFLDRMNAEHGNLRAFVRSIGVSDAAIASLERTLLE